MFTGVHHTALITRDLETTARFWRDALGLPLTGQIHHDGFKHWFFQVTPTDSIAFFEYSEDTPEHIATKRPGVVPTDGRHLDHLALGVPDDDALESLRKRLQEHGVDVRGPIDHKFCHSIYFEDPNGISLEACCPT